MPVFAAIPAIIGGVSAIVGAKKASNNAKQQNAILQQQTNQQQQLIDEQVKGAEQARGYSREFFDSAKTNLNQSNDYWQKIFGGDRNKINELLAPEMNQYLSSANSVEKALNIFGNRGNVGDRLIGSEFTKAANLAGARLNLKNQSVGQIQNLGQIFGNLGLSTGASAAGQTANASAALGGQQNITLTRLQGYQNQAAGFGQNIGQLLGAFNWQAKSVGDFFGAGKGQQSGNMSMSMFNSLFGGG